MRRYKLILIMLIIIGNLFGYSVMDRIAGNYTGNLDPRSAAMGSAAASGGNRFFDSLINPANLSFLPGTLGVQLNTTVMVTSENRSLPMYNSFDAYIDDATYVSNSNYYPDISLGAYYKKSMQDIQIAAGLSFYPYLSFDSNYDEQVRNNANSDYNNYPPIIARNSLEGDGTVYAYDLAVAVSYREFISLGLEIAKLSGETKLKRKINWSDQAFDMTSEGELSDTLNTLNRDFDGLKFTIGARTKINSRLGVGFAYTPKIEFDLKGKADGTDLDEAVYIYYARFDSLQNLQISDSLTFADFNSPARLRSGFSWEPRNIMRTYLNCDFEYVWWSDANKIFADVMNYYIGVEHRFSNHLPLRIGFNYQTSYSVEWDSGIAFAQKITEPTFTLGTGFTFMDRFEFDFSLSYCNRKYETLDLFQDSFYDYEDLWANYYYLNLEDRGWENPDTVKENFYKFIAAVNYNW
ncbi:MAG: outer membrane protein transport protein [Candidatus Cloacimonetes bacterium]|nr:outer membrane protein transport protein [Candidatus Cloacimonadota bacterium]